MLKIEGLPEPEFPAEYDPNFLPTKEADEFCEYFDEWFYCDRINQKSGLIQKRKGAAFAVDPEHSLIVPTSIKLNPGPFENVKWSQASMNPR